jgi:hypothetical protein
VTISSDIHLERKFLDFFFLRKKLCFPIPRMGSAGRPPAVVDPAASILQPGANVLKLFTAVIYGFSLQARVFVPSKPLEPSLMFAEKDGAYLRVECLEDAPL